MPLGELVLHIARITGGIADCCHESPREVPDFGNRPKANFVQEVLTTREQSVNAAGAQLAEWGEGDLSEEWRTWRTDRAVASPGRHGSLGDVQHLYHHRDELLVYLRRSTYRSRVYGPSADENPIRRVVSAWMTRGRMTGLSAEPLIRR